MMDLVQLVMDSWVRYTNLLKIVVDIFADIFSIFHISIKFLKFQCLSCSVELTPLFVFQVNVYL